MVVNFKVFKKCSPNGKVTVYMGKRDFVDHISAVEPIDGVVVLDDEYVRERRKIFGQVVCSFRYGREVSFDSSCRIFCRNSRSLNLNFRKMKSWA